MEEARFKTITVGCLSIYDAFRGAGKPIILLDENGFNVNVYVDEDGNIQGVKVSQPETIIGEIPEEAAWE